MRILSITAQKPDSTGSGVYLAELVKEFGEKGHEQAVVAGVYEEDQVRFPKGVRFYPVYFTEGRKDAEDCGARDAWDKQEMQNKQNKQSKQDKQGCGARPDTDSSGISGKLPFPIAGMSDEMPYPSTRYCEMTPEMAGQFKETFLHVIKRAVDELEPDLILCHHLYLLTAVVREAFPAHTVYGFCHNTDLRQMKKTDLEREFIREQIKRLDRIFVPQRAQEEGVLEVYGVSPDRIMRAGMGYNSKVFQRTGDVPEDGTVRMVFAGKIAEKKGVISLLRALSHLDCGRDRLKVFLAGSTGNQEEYRVIERLAGQCPYEVTFLGRLTQPELAKVYNACDIFVLPSFFEGIPLTVIEALACGDRVVMTDLPGVREWLFETAPGADIRYVPLPAMRNTDEPVQESLPEFEKNLAEALKESIEQKERRYADVSGISWEKIAEEVLQATE